MTAREIVRRTPRPSEPVREPGRRDPTSERSTAEPSQVVEVEVCYDCGAPIEPEPAFDIRRCVRCAVRAGKEDAR